MRDSTIIYRSFFEAIKELPKENQADVWNAIFEFTLNFNEIELAGINKTIFTLILPNLKTLNRNFKNGSQPKTKRNGSETEAKRKPIKSETEAYKDKDKDKDKKSKVLLPTKNVGLHKNLKNLFISCYKTKFKEEYYWTAKDATNLNSLINKIKFKVKEKFNEESEEKIVDSFKHILLSISDKWILDNFSIAIINSKFNDIILQIKANENGNNQKSFAERFKEKFGDLYANRDSANLVSVGNGG